MADLKSGEMAEVERLAKPADTEEAKILEGNKVREEALEAKAGESSQNKIVVEETKVEEPKLAKLSAAEFRAYNSMAEHMEYFVCSSPFLIDIYILGQILI